MSYRYLSSLEKFGINLGLDRIKYLLNKLGNPHLQFQPIHITGTNGKGSTAAMIASILKEAGYRVGLYTSPHLFDYTERIKINERAILHKDFLQGIKRVQRAAKGLKRQPTVFEVLTAVAFWYFAKKKIDYAVVEVGMGGRLDATNVLSPLVSIITNVELEHTQILGKTLAKIAAEKAAIIKPGVPVVTAEWKKKPLKVIKRFAEKQRSLLIQVNRNQKMENWKLSGPHQAVNSACAVAAIRLAGIKVTKYNIRNGLRQVNWPGRFQVVSRQPLVIVDGAHNPAGIKALGETVKIIFPQKEFTIIFGCQRDKDYSAMLKELKLISPRIIITQSTHANSFDARRLAKRTSHSQYAPHLKAALKVWNKQGPLIITGSLFLVAEALKLLDA